MDRQCRRCPEWQWRCREQPEVVVVVVDVMMMNQVVHRLRAASRSALGSEWPSMTKEIRYWVLAAAAVAAVVEGGGTGDIGKRDEEA